MTLNCYSLLVFYPWSMQQLQNHSNSQYLNADALVHIFIQCFLWYNARFSTLPFSIQHLWNKIKPKEYWVKLTASFFLTSGTRSPHYMHSSNETFRGQIFCVCACVCFFRTWLRVWHCTLVLLRDQRKACHCEFLHFFAFGVNRQTGNVSVCCLYNVCWLLLRDLHTVFCMCECDQPTHQNCHP